MVDRNGACSGVLFVVALSLSLLAGSPVSAQPATTDSPPEVKNSIGMKLKLIPAGEFLMGSPENEETRSNGEGPQHKVRISQPFYVGVYEVTQAEYQAVKGINPSQFSSTGSFKEKVAGVETSQFPVENVTWFDCLEFCNQLSAKEGFPPYYSLVRPQQENGSITFANVIVSGGNGYRLPSEAQWEYACRAGTTTPFHFGASHNGREANTNGILPYGTSRRGPNLGRPTSVGTYAANSFGLHDMHGNVFEWCFDGFDKDAYKKRGQLTTDPLSANADRRVLRGASWIWPAGLARAAYRESAPPADRGAEGGFRVIRIP